MRSIPASLVAANFESVNESARAMTGRTLDLLDIRRITLISAGDIVRDSSSSSDSSPEDVSGINSGGWILDIVTSERVLIGDVISRVCLVLAGIIDNGSTR